MDAEKTRTGKRERGAGSRTVVAVGRSLGGTSQPPRGSGRGRVVGVALLVACAVLYAASAVLLAFAPLTPEWRFGSAAVLAVTAEGAFWFAAILLGREVVRRYRRALNPLNWFGGRRRGESRRLEEVSSEDDPEARGGER